MKKLLIFVLLCGGIASGYLYHRQADKKEWRISTAEVTRGDIIDTVDALGTLQPLTNVKVGAQVTGKITEVGADYNSIVKRGAVLARIDPAFVQAQIQQARANFTRVQVEQDRLAAMLMDAQKKFARSQELKTRHLLPASEFEGARVALDLARAQLRSAEAQTKQAAAALSQQEINLDHTVIRSPIDGIVVSRSVDVGQTVSANTQAPVLFVLAGKLTSMQALANIREQDVGRVHPGQRVGLKVDAYPQQQFTGTLEEVRLEPHVSRNIVTYSAVIEVPNPARKLRPGMTANLSIEIGERHNVLRVPTSALRFTPSAETLAALSATPTDDESRAGADGNDDPATDTTPAREPEATLASSPESPAQATSGSEDDVWVLEDGTIEPVDVKLGISDGQMTELVAGALSPGDELVWSVADAQAVRPKYVPRNRSPFNSPGRRGVR